MKGLMQMKKKLTPLEKEQKAELREEVKILIRKGLKENKDDLKGFLEEVVPLFGLDYYLFLVDKEKTSVTMKFDRDEYIDALCSLSQYPDHTLFYQPCSFDGWKNNDKAVCLNCLYVDIDEIDFFADENDKASTVRFLKERYNLTDEQLPDYIVLSGRGIHCVYLIPELFFYAKTIERYKGRKKIRIPNPKPCPRVDCKNKEACAGSESCMNINVFKKYTDSLITTFSSDFTGSSINHMYRCPTSFNIKGREIKGKLFKIKDTAERDIHTLDWALKTEEEIFDYHKYYYARRGEKSKATQEKNRQKNEQNKAEFMEVLGEQTIEEYIERDDITEEDRAYADKLMSELQSKKVRGKEAVMAAIKNTEYYDEEKALPYKHLEVYTGYRPENRTWNLLLDLHNFFIRHEGILVSRNLFFFLISNYLKMQGFSYYYALKYCRRYVDRHYYDEMEDTVSATYNTERTYSYTYEEIAYQLGFTEEDIEKSYCNFSKERKREAKRETDRRYYERKKDKEGISPAKKKRAEEKEYIKNHPDMKWQEAKEILGISRTKYFGIRNELGLSKKYDSSK